MQYEEKYKKSTVTYLERERRVAISKSIAFCVLDRIQNLAMRIVSCFLFMGQRYRRDKFLIWTDGGQTHWGFVFYFMIPVCWLA